MQRNYLLHLKEKALVITLVIRYYLGALQPMNLQIIPISG
jgi:hypothetical protein